MLKLKYLYEDFDEARECLKLYDPDEKSLEKMLEHFRISSNAVYPFRDKTSGKICFLRISPAEEKPYRDILSEIRLINWLIGQGYPAARPFPMLNGEFTAQIWTQWGMLNISCFEIVPGHTLEDTEGTPEIVYGYGKLLGQLHRNLTEYPYASERRNHEELMAEIRERLIRYNAPENVRKEYEAVSRALRLLPVDTETYGIVHYDFEPDNVMYNPEDSAFGVIDFDDAIRCWYALDLVRAIDALEDVAGNIPAEEAAERFLEGYRSEKAFTDAQMETLPLMRRLVRLENYAAIRYVLSEEIEDPPEWMTEIIQKLTRKQAEIEEQIRRNA